MSAMADRDPWIPASLKVYLLLVGTGQKSFPNKTEALHRSFEEVRGRQPELFPTFGPPVVLLNYPYSDDLRSALFMLMNAGHVYLDAPWFKHYFLVEEDIKPLLASLRKRNLSETEALLALGPEFAELLDKFCSDSQPTKIER